MASFFGTELGINMPSFSGIGNTLTILGIVFIIFVLCAIGIWFWFQNKIYNKKVVIFENIGNQGYQKTGEDRARLIKVGDGGEEILFLKNRKSYRTAYGKKMGNNVYWFAVGQDGYWYNCTLGDLDAKMGMLDIEPVDRDMRYMHVAIRKNIQERYKKVSFMEKYGTIIMNSVFLLIMLIGLWFLVDKLGDVSVQATEVLKSNQQTLEVIKQALSKVDTICSGGSGYIIK